MRSRALAPLDVRAAAKGRERFLKTLREDRDFMKMKDRTDLMRMFRLVCLSQSRSGICLKRSRLLLVGANTAMYLDTVL